MESTTNLLLSAQHNLVALHNFTTAETVTQQRLWKKYGHTLNKDDAIHALIRAYLKDTPKCHRKLLHRVILHPKCQLDHKLIASHALLKAIITQNTHTKFNALESDEFNLIKSQARNQQPTALYLLGLLHIEHPKAINCHHSNIQQALHYLVQAKNHGNPLAFASIGYIYKNLYSYIGIPKDEAHQKAQSYYECAVKAGHASAANSLGVSYFTNTLQAPTDGGQSHITRAINLFRESLINHPDCPFALYNLAAAYNTPNASTYNPKEAFQYFKQSADLGNINAKIQLANIYGDPERAQLAGLQGPDYPKELEVLQEAAATKTQNSSVFHRIGMIHYDNNLAIQAGLPNKDLKVARLAFDEAVKLGHAGAKNMLGIILYTPTHAKNSGLKGPDYKRALALFEEAVKASPQKPTYCYNLANALVYHSQYPINRINQDRILSLYTIALSTNDLSFTSSFFSILSDSSLKLTSHFRARGLILVRKVLSQIPSPGMHAGINDHTLFIPATWHADEDILYTWQLYQVFKSVGANHFITTYIDPHLSNAHKQSLLIGDTLVPLSERYKVLLQLRYQNDSASDLTYRDGVPYRTLKSSLESIANALESSTITRPNSITEIWGDTYANRLFSLISGTHPILQSSKADDIKWCRDYK